MPTSKVIKWQGWACTACGWEHFDRLIVAEHERECPAFWDDNPVAYALYLTDTGLNQVQP